MSYFIFDTTCAITHIFIDCCYYSYNLGVKSPNGYPYKICHTGVKWEMRNHNTYITSSKKIKELVVYRQFENQYILIW